MAKPTGRAIRDELIEGAIDLIQTRGIGEFSYGALADAIGIKAPSIHHHFPRKDQLVAEVAVRYAANFNVDVQGIQESSAVKRIVAYAEIYAKTARAERTCLCGAIAAEWASIGEEAQAVVDQFFSDQIAWIRKQVLQGQRADEIRSEGVSALQLARVIFSSLQGSLLLARSDNAFANTSVTTRDLLSHFS